MGNRIEYFDLAKGFCIVLVVWFHVFEYYDIQLPMHSFFSSFRMPLYFVLSGCFFKTYSGIVDFTKRKCNKLLIPFSFFYVTTSLFIPFLLFEFFDIRMQHGQLYYNSHNICRIIAHEGFPNVPIWFLLCLFEINMIFYVVMLLGNKTKKPDAIIFLCTFLIGAAGLVCSYFRIYLPGFIDSSFSSFPFFVFGYYVYRRTNMLKPNKTDGYLLCFVVVLVIAVAILSYNCDFRFAANIFGLKEILVLYPCGVMGALSVFFLTKYFKHIPVLSYWGRYSIMLLVSHQLVYQVFAYVLSFLNLSVVVVAFINTVLTLGVYMFLIPFMLKYMPYVTAQKDLIRI